MKRPTGSIRGCGNCVHTCIAIEKLIMDKTHVEMLGISSEDDNNDSIDNAAFKEDNVEENATVEENGAYEDKNVDENAVLLLAPSFILSFIMPFPNNRS
jgi:hypothetical protein